MKGRPDLESEENSLSVLFCAFIQLAAASSLKRDRPVRLGADPWGASTLAWAGESPSPPWNFAYTPVAGSLTPLWDSPALRVMDGVAIERREVIVTSVVDTASLYRQKSAAPSIWPIVAAFAVTAMFLGSIFTPWVIVAGALPIAAALTGWFWPQRGRAKTGPLRVRP